MCIFYQGQHLSFPLFTLAYISCTWKWVLFWSLHSTLCTWWIKFTLQAMSLTQGKVLSIFPAGTMMKVVIMTEFQFSESYYTDNLYFRQLELWKYQFLKNKSSVNQHHKWSTQKQEVSVRRFQDKTGAHKAKFEAESRKQNYWRRQRKLCCNIQGRMLASGSTSALITLYLFNLHRFWMLSDFSPINSSYKCKIEVQNGGCSVRFSL